MGALLVGATACTSADGSTQPVEPIAVELSPDGLPDDVTIGVVASLSSPTGEGSQWREAAEGAQVAAYRYGLGETGVALTAEDDRGTRQGAVAAVEKLVDQGVTGIVLATAGDHVTSALEVASDAGVPVLMPYSGAADQLPVGVWTTGPRPEQAGAALASAIESSGVSSPAFVDAGGGKPAGLDVAGGEVFRPGDDAARLAATLARRAQGPQPIDSVVVSGPAESQALVVGALQEKNLDVPVFLSGDALSPAFPAALAEAGGSLSGQITSVGIDNSDVVALDPGQPGAAVSAFLAGVRATAQDGRSTDFFDAQPFGTVAGAADARSHDAVVALATAAAEAGSAEPAEVMRALESLRVSRTDGLAGPGLDFGDSEALPEDAVVPLQATTQDPGLRPVDAAASPRLLWFALPRS
jgi:ABC-type branched-subunit amino acid transport system substrate-binding protein